MKRNKFKDLISIAERAVNLPDRIEIRSMEVDKHIYLQDDTFNPVILIFSNYISQNICGKNLFKINVVKSEESLCFGLITEDGEDDSEDTESDALRLLILIESLTSIFDVSNKKILDLTDVVVNWRKALTLLDENETVKPDEHMKMLVINNLTNLKNYKLKNEKENKIG
jgi:hypothetical protein